VHQGGCGQRNFLRAWRCSLLGQRLGSDLPEVLVRAARDLGEEVGRVGVSDGQRLGQDQHWERAQLTPCRSSTSVLRLCPIGSSTDVFVTRPQAYAQDLGRPHGLRSFESSSIRGNPCRPRRTGGDCPERRLRFSATSRAASLRRCNALGFQETNPQGCCTGPVSSCVRARAISQRSVRPAHGCSTGMPCQARGLLAAYRPCDTTLHAMKEVSGPVLALSPLRPGRRGLSRCSITPRTRPN
jgi:hypothetical protein